MNALSQVPSMPQNRYAGDVSPQQAWDALSSQATAQLVDVRTAPEWHAGAPDLAQMNKQTHMISLKNAPDFAYNSQFAQSVIDALPDRDTPIYFLCKVGGRSAEAATQLAQHGYTNCYNIAGGFEGLETTPGWKQTNLPWEKK